MPKTATRPKAERANAALGQAERRLELARAKLADLQRQQSVVNRAGDVLTTEINRLRNEPLPDDPAEAAEAFKATVVAGLARQEAGHWANWLNGKLTEARREVGEAERAVPTAFESAAQSELAQLDADLARLESLPWADRPDVKAAIVEIREKREDLLTELRQEWQERKDK